MIKNNITEIKIIIEKDHQPNCIQNVSTLWEKFKGKLLPNPM